VDTDKTQNLSLSDVKAIADLVVKFHNRRPYWVGVSICRVGV
jgi:hypothetical protein